MTARGCGTPSRRGGLLKGVVGYRAPPIFRRGRPVSDAQRGTGQQMNAQTAGSCSGWQRRGPHTCARGSSCWSPDLRGHPSCASRARGGCPLPRPGLSALFTALASASRPWTSCSRRCLQTLGPRGPPGGGPPVVPRPRPGGGRGGGTVPFLPSGPACRRRAGTPSTASRRRSPG